MSSGFTSVPDVAATAGRAPARRGNGPQSAGDRLARLLALVPYLIARPGVSVATAASDFGISEARLIDDLELLFVCGLPGHLPDDLIDATFEGGVITVSNADTLARPLRLTGDEAVALLSGLQVLAELPGGDPDTDELVTRLLVKLQEATAAVAPVAGLAIAAPDAVGDAGPTGEAAAVAESTLRTLRGALERQRALRMRYFVPSRDELTDRVVDPMRLLVVDGRTYLEAWSRGVEAVRIFRTDRIESVVELDEPSRPPGEARPRDIDAGVFQAGPGARVVTLDVTAGARWVAEYYPSQVVSELPDGGLRISLATHDLAWVVRLVLRSAGAARVVAPPEAVQAVGEAAAAGLASLADSAGPTAD
ncbi:MAG: helix-turn-helix transcriptional regulator [Actinomycetes bacterium]